MTTKDLEELYDVLNCGKEDAPGFILLPNIGGFQLFEIDKERLELYLKMETLHHKIKSTNSDKP